MKYLLLAIVALPLLAFPTTLYLSRSEVKGSFRYCFYTYGIQDIVVTIKNYDLCPTQITRDL